MPPSRMAAFPRRLAVFTAEALAQICRPVSGGNPTEARPAFAP